MNTPEMETQRQLIREFDDALMESAIDRDMHYQVEREYRNEIRGKKCTNCRRSLYRGHFHAIGGHSVCCLCVPRVPNPGIKTVRTAIQTKGRSKKT